MGSFKDILSKDDVNAVKAYVRQQSHTGLDAAYKKK